MAKKTLYDLDASGKNVLVRVDFNVPLENGVITDDNRIVQALPTIKYLIEKNAKVLLMSHLGRPDGAFAPDGSLAPVAAHLSKLLGKTVVLGPQEVIGEKLDAAVAALKPGDVLLLENVRFHAGETMPDKAKKNPDKKLTPEQQAVHEALIAGLAKYADLYVNDAFGTSHRKHASMYGVPKAIQKKGGVAVAGFLVEKEIKYLDDAVKNPVRPFVAILGGAKVSDKIAVIENLIGKVNTIIIGGGMAYTFYKAKGRNIGKSLLEADRLEIATSILEKAKAAGVEVLLPVDNIIADKFAADAATKVAGTEIEDGWMALDIGPKTAELYANAVRAAKTVVWNGPMGVFEMDAFSKGTFAVAKALAEATKLGACTIIGGGDSAAAIAKAGLADQVTHVSTGGGASLEYLEGKVLPGVDVLSEK
jgi:phosphoglycerate kinase